MSLDETKKQKKTPPFYCRQANLNPGTTSWLAHVHTYSRPPKVANTFGLHKTCRKIAWHSPDGKTHNQIDYIMMKKRFKTNVNIAKIRSFPGADIGSDHELAMMTFKLYLKRAKKQCKKRIRFDLDKLKDPEVAEIFQAKIGGKFAALSILDSDMDMDMLTDTFNTAVTDTANEIIGKYRPVKNPGSQLTSLICVPNGESSRTKRTTKIEMEWHSTEQLTKQSRKA